MIFTFSLTISFLFNIWYLLGCVYFSSYYTLCVFMVSIQHFSRLYPANIINIVSVIFQDINFSFRESPSLDF